MAWKDIICFADAEGEGAARVRLGAQLANRSQAHLEAHALVMRPELSPDMLVGALADDYAAALELTRTEAKRAVEAITLAGPKLGPTFSVHAEEVRRRHVRRLSAALARTSDLAIAPLPAAGGVDLDILLGAAVDAGRPCLLAPRSIIAPKIGERILIAWKATPEAARAVAAAMPLIAEAEAIRIVLVNPRGPDDGEDARGLDRLSTHLLRHGAHIEETLIRHTDIESVADLLVSEANAFRADLFVMGAYGHARLREFLFGGVTRQMLRESTLPILIAN